jgi:hypothetical protein
MILGSIVVPAQEFTSWEHITNGGFETQKDGVPLNWSFSGGAFGNDFSISNENPWEGSTALKINTQTSSLYLTHRLLKLVEGETYEFSCWAKIDTQYGKGMAIKFEFQGKDEDGRSISLREAHFENDYPNLPKGSWQKISFSFTAPKRVTGATLLLRYYGGGVAYYDDVSVKGPYNEYTVKPIVPGMENLVSNGDMEDIIGAMPQLWDRHSSAMVNLSDDAHSGNYSINIKNETDSSAQPWARYKVSEDIVEGAEYQTTLWIKTTSSDVNFKFKWEFRRRLQYVDDYFITGYNSESFETTTGVWHKIVARTRIPKECKVVYIYARVFGLGEVYIDDLEFYMTELPPKVYSDSDVYYYTGWETGKASVTINDYYSIDPLSTIDFILRDEDKVLSNQLNTTLNNNKADFEFSVMDLAEIGKPYYIDMIYKDRADNVIAQETEEVHRYNRPTRLNEDGLAIVNGEVFTPVIGYHVPIELLPRLKEAGINTVQSYHYNNSEGRKATSADIETLIEYLDEAHKYGIMVLPVLYPNMLAAGHPDNVERTQAAVAAVKDHPAVLGYMVLDEPYNQVGAYGTTYEDIDKWLKASYKVIRDIDSHNVVYACCTGYRQEEAVKYVDVFARDPYPPGNRQMSIFVSNSISEAVKVTKNRKPVWVINAAVAVLGGFEPDSNSVRHMAYQSLFAGAKALGWYQIQSAVQVGVLREEIWNREGIWEGIECFAQREQEDAIKHFITGEYPLFNEQRGEDDSVWWRSFKKGRDIYYIILSREVTQNTISIPIESKDGSEKVGQYEAIAEDISGAPHIMGNETLVVTLEPEQVIRYKVTPLTGREITDGRIISTANRTFTGTPVWPAYPEESQGTSITFPNWEDSSDESPISGGECLKMTSGGESFSAQRYFMNLYNDKFEPGVMYRVSLFLKTEYLGEDVKPYIFIEFAGMKYSDFNVTGEGFETFGQWKQVDCLFTIPEIIDDSPCVLMTINLCLPGEGVIYWDDVRFWKDDFIYYKNNSTVSSLSDGIINTAYQLTNESHEVGDTVTMITAIYRTSAHGLNLVGVAPVLSAEKQSDSTISIKNSIDIKSEYVKEGTIIKTFFWDTLSNMLPINDVEVLVYIGE